MKIFLAFLQSETQHPIAAYSFWQYYIKKGIEEAGDQWEEDPGIDWAKGIVPQAKEELAKWKEETWAKAVKFVKQNKPDVFLSYLYPTQIDEQAIQEIKKTGICCINFFCDNVRNFTSVPPAFRVFDLNWVPEYRALKMYSTAGFPFINLPMPMWVDPKFRKPAATENDRIAFIGSKDIQRHLLFEQLFSQHPHAEIDIYGAGWNSSGVSTTIPTNAWRKLLNQLSFIKQFGINAYLNKIRDGKVNPVCSVTLLQHLKGKPDFDEYIRITRESTVVIGVNRYPGFQFPLYKPGSYSRLRDIEASMLGACYLTEYTEGLSDLFEIGTEIETFSNIEELNGQIAVLKNDSAKRRSLREKGQQAALNRLSIPQSLAKIKKIIGGGHL